MAEPKTIANKASVIAFLTSTKSETQRADARVIHDLMKSITRKKAKMWGPSIIGFGSYHSVYATGREGDWPILAFSPRKQNMTIYVMDGFKDKQRLLKKLGKCKTRGSCLYIKKLGDLHAPTLKAILQASYKTMIKKYGS